MQNKFSIMLCNDLIIYKASVEFFAVLFTIVTL